MLTLEPAGLEEAARNSPPQRSSQVCPMLRPVEASEREAPSRPGGLGNVYTEPVESLWSRAEIDDSAPARRSDRSFLHQRLKKRNAQASGQVVVAGTSLGEG